LKEERERVVRGAHPQQMVGLIMRELEDFGEWRMRKVWSRAVRGKVI
jgi:hypothetical protein